MNAALLYVSHLPSDADLQPVDGYILIASRQEEIGDFRGARETIDRIADARAKRVDYSLVVRCQALMQLATKLLAAGRKETADQTLNEAGRESLRISSIFVEMGDGPTIWQAQAWLGIAELRWKAGQKRAARRTLAKAENNLTATISLGIAGDLLKRVAVDYQLFGDQTGARRAALEQRIIALQEGYGQGADDRLQASVEVYAQDANISGVLSEVRQAQISFRDAGLSVDLLCDAARIRHGKGDKSGSARLLVAARSLTATIKDPSKKQRATIEIMRSVSAGPGPGFDL